MLTSLLPSEIHLTTTTTTTTTTMEEEEVDSSSRQKQQNMKPRLERRNAMKNINYQIPFTFHDSSYDYSDTSSSSSSSSIHLSPSLLKQTTFRIHGNEEEHQLHHLFATLGLSGPQDFSIPTSAWQQSQKSKLLSSSSSSSSNGVGLNTTTTTTHVVIKNPSFHQVGGDESDKDHEIAKVNVFSDSSKVYNNNDSNNTSIRDSGGGGIKGVRPPVLAILDDSDNINILSDKRDNLVLYDDDDNDDDDDDDDDSDGGGRSENDYSLVDDYSIHNVSPNGSFRRTFSSWQKGEILGKGSFGTVYEGFTDDGIFFAVKEVSLVDEGSQAKQSIFQLQQEIYLLSQFEHENIVRYFGTDKDNNMLYIFLELVTKGSLASLYQKYRLRDSQVSAYTRQILSGLKYLHDRNVVHRDIKCANILVDASGSVKLADFGLAKATKLNDVKSSKGSPYWMAPEVVNLRNHGYGLAADIWSLGCTVLEMLTRQPPYSHLEGMQALFRIGRGQPPPVPESLSKDARDFILKCLQVNPSKRPTSTQLLDHPFIKRPLLSPMSPISP